MRPARPEPQAPGTADLERARAVMTSSNSSEACLALVGDKRLLFDETGSAFVMYGIKGTSWIAMGDLVGPESQWGELRRTRLRRGSRSGTLYMITSCACRVP